MVSVDDAIERSLVAELADLRRRVAQTWVWPSPDAGCVLWLYRSCHVSTPPEWRLPLDAIAAGRWSEAPMLSAAGYAIGLGEPAPPSWCAGIDRLTERLAVSADRTSFLYRPTELFGIAVGVRTAATLVPTATSWLQHLLGNYWPEHEDEVANLLTRAAAQQIVTRPPGTDQSVSSNYMSPAALALVMCLRTAGALDDAPEAAPDRAALPRAVMSWPRTTDSIGAAAVVIALERTIDEYFGGVAVDGASPVDRLVAMWRGFPRFVRELAHRHDGRSPLEVKDEYDVQDLVRALLRIEFEDVRREETSPSHAGARPRLDFLLKRERIVVEVKVTSVSHGQDKIRRELAEDKEIYRSHPDCETLVCFVYDPDHRCRDAAALERDLTEERPGLRTIVLVTPK